MLRLLALLLLLLNGAYYAWSQGLLSAYGLAPAPQEAEPLRLTQQIRPEALRLLSAEEAASLAAAAAATAPARATECLQAGLYDEQQSAILRQALAAWPTSAWRLEAASEPARWLVYMGRYASTDAVARKKAELRHFGVVFEPPPPALEPGLSLGGFDSRERAVRAQAGLAARGVQTARVVQERLEQHGQLLKLPVVDDGLRPRLVELEVALAGKPLRPCEN